MIRDNEVMDSVEDFKKSLEGFRPSTLRVYVAGAKTAINAVKANVSQCRSYAELLALILEAQPAKRARIAPFLRFLQGDQPRGRQLRARRGCTRDPILGDSNLGKTDPEREKPLNCEQARYGAAGCPLRRTL